MDGGRNDLELPLFMDVREFNVRPSDTVEGGHDEVIVCLRLSFGRLLISHCYSCN